MSDIGGSGNKVAVTNLGENFDGVAGIKTRKFLGEIGRSKSSREVTKEPVQTDERWDYILDEYRKTPAYDIRNAQDKNRWSGQNTISNRWYRFKKEPIVVVEQTRWESFNYVFTTLLLVLTIWLILYEKKNNLQLIPLDEYENVIDKYDTISKMSEEEKKKKLDEDKKNLEYYKNIKLASDVTKGLSIAYIVGLGARRIYKRTMW